MKTILDRFSPLTGLILLGALVATVLFSEDVLAHEQGEFIVRAGYTSVMPDTDSSTVHVATVGDVGMGVDVDDGAALGLNLVYMLNDQWGVELLAASPFSHDIDLINTSDNGLGLGDGLLAETKHLPPTVSALYYFPMGDGFQPYVGLGLNYTFFFEEEFSGARQAQSFNNLKLDDSFGVAAQAGFDMDLNDTWMLNASVRYINIETDAEFDVLGLKGKVSAELNPWVWSLMLGHRF